MPYSTLIKLILFVRISSVSVPYALGEKSFLYYILWTKLKRSMII